MDSPEHGEKFSTFLPLVLIESCIAILFVWNMVGAVEQRMNAIRVRDQQAGLYAQAAQAEEKLRMLVADLVELAETDADALSIVKKYRIASGPLPAAAPQPSTPGTDVKTEGSDAARAPTADQAKN